MVLSMKCRNLENITSLQSCIWMDAAEVVAFEKHLNTLCLHFIRM